jgi:hypothetical protein
LVWSGKTLPVAIHIDYYGSTELQHDDNTETADAELQQGPPQKVTLIKQFANDKKGRKKTDGLSLLAALRATTIHALRLTYALKLERALKTEASYDPGSDKSE